MDAAYVPLLLPVVTGLVAALGLYLKEWRLARDKKDIRNRAIADANAEVAFASEWWKATQLLGSDAPPDSPKRMLAFLADAEALVAGTQHLGAAQRNPVTLSRVLLLYPMHGRWARIVRRLFFASVLWLIVAALGVALDLTSSDPSIATHDVGGGISLIIGSMVLTLLLRFGASALERDAATTIPSTPTAGTGIADPAQVADPVTAPGTTEIDGQRPDVVAKQQVTGGP